ncbi:MAG: undecaprenyl-diphosphate phosphatase [Candidatus Omnitrophica bacterium]|nr:undecaprenyl-diphosphate phosphatase [Candidatus Omnitrophota bacterium]
MDWLSACILGVVEGVTEFLPVSSTGHMILAGKLMGLPATDFLKSFEIAIQLGAILAVVVLYTRTLLVRPSVILKVACAFLPTAVIGLLLYKIVKKVLLGSSSVVLWALLLGGIFLVLFELFYKERRDGAGLEGVTIKQAFIIGVFQSLAVIPGVSRSAATIVGGLCLGLNRSVAAEFSFLVAVPTMAAAAALDLSKSAMAFTGQDMLALAIGFLVSFAVAVVVIKGFVHYVQRNNFLVFGVYRIVLAVALLWFWRV